jgi:O-antigen/teichoic acid export membrane protein
MNFRSFKETTRRIAKLGFFSELSNVLQILVRRANYIFAETLLGTGFLGLYSVSMQLSETIKVIGNSMATVQYAEVANSDNHLRNKLLTVRLFKAAVVLTTIASFVIVLIPDSIYTFVFGDEFAFLNDLLWWLLPAMIAMAIRAILSHHFAGIGKPYINTITAGVGIVTVVPLGYLLTVDGMEVSQEMGLVGLAAAASVGFSIQALFQWVWFARMEKVGIRDFMLKSTDFTFVKHTIQKFLKREDK